MSNYIESRDTAAEKSLHDFVKENTFPGPGSTYEWGFQRGADWGAFHSPIVLDLVEAIYKYREEQHFTDAQLYAALDAFNAAKEKVGAKNPRP